MGGKGNSACTLSSAQFGRYTQTTFEYQKMKPSERLRHINTIASKLQQEYSTSQINVLLAGFGIENSGEQIVPSKRIHVENKLSTVSDNLIVKIGNELGIVPESTVDLKHEKLDLKEKIIRELVNDDPSVIDMILDEYPSLKHSHHDFETLEEYISFKIREMEVSDLYAIKEYLGKRNLTDGSYSFWGNCELKVFISHLSKDKAKATALAKELKKYGATGFVAHIDIEPSEEWLKTLEFALQSMDVMLALLTERFKESDWTVQEIGFALGKGVPIVAIRKGMDPFGFFGKWQAIQGTRRYPKDIIQNFIGVINQKLNRQLKSKTV